MGVPFSSGLPTGGHLKIRDQQIRLHQIPVPALIGPDTQIGDLVHILAFAQGVHDGPRLGVGMGLEAHGHRPQNDVAVLRCALGKVQRVVHRRIQNAVKVQHEPSAVVILRDRPLLAGGPDLLDLALHFLLPRQQDQILLQLALLLRGRVLILGHLILNRLKDQLEVAQKDDQNHQDQQQDRFPPCQFPIHSATSVSGCR